MKQAFKFVRDTFSEWQEDKASRLAAALAYYTIFSIAPLLIVIIGIAGLVFGQQATQGQLVGQIQGLVGKEGATLIQTMIQNASKPGAGILATVIGIVTLLLGASGVFGQLQDSLNTIWEVAPRPDLPLRARITQRLLPFGMVLGIGFLLLVSLVVSAALSALTAYLARVLPIAPLLQVINLLVSFCIITLLFAMMYKVLPDVEIGWRDVWVGAAVTSLLFTIGKFLIGLYLGRSSVASAYGAAGSLVLVLLWIYYSAQILFLGAEFTQVYARRYGTRIEPSPIAIALTEDMRGEQGIPHRAQVQRLANEGSKQPQPERPAPAPQPQSRGAGLSPAHLFAASQGARRPRGAGAVAAAAAGAVLFGALAAARRLTRRS